MQYKWLSLVLLILVVAIFLPSCSINQEIVEISGAIADDITIYPAPSSSEIIGFEEDESPEEIETEPENFWISGYSFESGTYGAIEQSYRINIFEVGDELKGEIYVPAYDNGIYGKLDVIEDGNSIDLVLTEYYFEYVQPNAIGDTLIRLTRNDDDSIYTEWIDYIPGINRLAEEQEQYERDVVTDGACFRKNSLFDMPKIGTRLNDDNRASIGSMDLFSWTGFYAFSTGFCRNDFSFYWLDIYEENSELIGDIYANGRMFALFSRLKVIENDGRMEFVHDSYYGTYNHEAYDPGDILFALSITEDNLLYTEWIDMAPLPNINIAPDIVEDGICFIKLDKRYEMPNKE